MRRRKALYLFQQSDYCAPGAGGGDATGCGFDFAGGAASGVVAFADGSQRDAVVDSKDGHVVFGICPGQFPGWFRVASEERDGFAVGVIVGVVSVAVIGDGLFETIDGNYEVSVVVTAGVRDGFRRLLGVFVGCSGFDYHCSIGLKRRCGFAASVTKRGFQLGVVGRTCMAKVHIPEKDYVIHACGSKRLLVIAQPRFLPMSSSVRRSFY